MTLLEFSNSVRSIAFPDREPKNLVEVNKITVIDTLIMLQKVTPELQSNNKSTWTKDETNSYCLTTSVVAPRGQIKRVYTTTESESCDRVFYNFVGHGDIEAWIKKARRTSFGSATLEESDVSYTSKYFSSEYDEKAGRSRFGRYSLFRGRIYVAPEIHSTEILNVEWDGIKRGWNDSDELDEVLYNEDVNLICRLAVKVNYYRHFMKDERTAQAIELELRQAIAAFHYEYDVMKFGHDENIAMD